MTASPPRSGAIQPERQPRDLLASPVATCRSCAVATPRPFLALGATPIANRLVNHSDAGPDPAFPLEVGHCAHCSLVQLTHELPAHALFDDDYPYFSSFSAMLRRHSERHALTLIEERRLGPDSLVVEVASNDGYLLRTFQEHGIPVLGIEPTRGPASAAEAAGIPTVQEFFGPELAARLVDAGHRADVIIANNVMAHVPDLNGFVAGLAALLKPDAILSVENPNVLDLVDRVEFDTIYHEHFCYFSTLAVDRLMRRHGLGLVAVERFEHLHGGTLRWRMSEGGQPSESALARLAVERGAGLESYDFYADFGERVRRTQAQLRALLLSIKSRGESIAAYGAAAKGATLLNSTGIDATVLDFVVDRNVHKQGKLMPGARVPIVPPEHLLREQPDYVLLLAWNVLDEVLEQQQEYRHRGGRFIVPVPTPYVM